MVIFFAVAGNSYLVIRSLIVFFLAEVGLPNNTVSPLSAALITKCLRFLYFLVPFILPMKGWKFWCYD